VDSESPIDRYSDIIIRLSLFFLLTFFVILFPRYVSLQDVQPIFKGPRPHNIQVSGHSGEKKSTLPAKPTTRESLFHSIIMDAADKHGIDPALLMAIIMAESNYNPTAISKRGAKGLMQLMPATADALGVEDSFNPEDNINGGAKYLKQLLNHYNGDLHLTLAAYNAGSGKVKKYQGIPPFKTTRQYVKKVFGYYRHYKGQIGELKKKT